MKDLVEDLGQGHIKWKNTCYVDESDLNWYRGISIDKEKEIINLKKEKEVLLEKIRDLDSTNLLLRVALKKEIGE